MSTSPNLAVRGRPFAKAHLVGLHTGFFILYSQLRASFSSEVAGSPTAPHHQCPKATSSILGCHPGNMSDRVRWGGGGRHVARQERWAETAAGWEREGPTEGLTRGQGPCPVPRHLPDGPRFSTPCLLPNTPTFPVPVPTTPSSTAPETLLDTGHLGRDSSSFTPSHICISFTPYLTTWGEWPRTRNCLLSPLSPEEWNRRSTGWDCWFGQ